MVKCLSSNLYRHKYAMADFTDLANKEAPKGRGKKRNSRQAFEDDGELKDNYSVQIDGERVGIYSKKGNPIVKTSREGMRAMRKIIKSRNMQKDMSDKLLSDEVAMAKAVGQDMKKHLRTAAEQETEDQVHRIGDEDLHVTDGVDGTVATKESSKTVVAKVVSNAVNVSAENEMAKLDELQGVEPDHERTMANEVQHVSVMEVDKEAVKEVVDTKQDEDKIGLDLTFRIVHEQAVLQLFGSTETYKRFFDAFVATRPQESRTNADIFAENKRIVEGTEGINVTSPMYDATAQRHNILLENVELKLMRGRIVGNPNDVPASTVAMADKQKHMGGEAAPVASTLSMKRGQRVGILVDATSLGISVSKLQALLQNDSKLSSFTSANVSNKQESSTQDGSTAGAGIFGDIVEPRSGLQRIGSQQNRAVVQNNTFKHNDLRLNNTHRIDATYPNVPRSKMLRNVEVEQKQYDRVLRFSTPHEQGRMRIS
jgi:hypothetical protein